MSVCVCVCECVCASECESVCGGGGGGAGCMYAFRILTMGKILHFISTLILFYYIFHRHRNLFKSLVTESRVTYFVP